MICFCCRSQNDVPQEHMAKEVVKKVRSTSEILDRQWTDDVPGGVRGYRGATGGGAYPS